MPGFFSKAALAKANASRPVGRMPRCGECGMYRSCLHPKQGVHGKGGQEILLVTPYPGATEDETGVQGVGPSAEDLRKACRRVGLDMVEDCWRVNALRCRPPAGIGKERLAKRATACRPLLLQTIKELEPRVIIPMGFIPVRALLGHLFKESVGGLHRWAGWTVPVHRFRAWVCPTTPSLELLGESRRDTAKLLRNWRQGHLQAALSCPGRPGPPKPYADLVRRYTPAQAAEWLDQLRDRGGGSPIAFDYETDRIKPDAPDATIHSCSVCWRGKATIAFPWAGPAVEAMRRVLRSPMPKIAANLKFEERWSRAVVGTRVRNWIWDTMQTAHLLDNRPDITSLKFQAFVRLGVEPWDHHIKPFLEAESSRAKNRIAEIPLEDLLLYNGVDAAVEYDLAVLQARDMNMSIGMNPWH